MRVSLFVAVLIASIALSVVLYAVSGGRVLFLGLPLLFAAPFAWWRR